MEFKWILWSMTGVLALLFFIAYHCNDKSKEKSRLEAIYYALLFKHKKNPEKQAKLKSAGTAYGKIIGLNPSEIEKMLANDLS